MVSNLDPGRLFPVIEFPLVEDRQVVTEGSPLGFVVGLDLGKSQDYTALIVDELFKCERQRWTRTAFEPMASMVRSRPVMQHRLANVHRYPRGTPYPDIYRSVKSVLAQLPARERQPELVVDKTGVGAPVVDAMREMDMRPIAVSITGGRLVNQISTEDFTVPKTVLASVLDILFAEDRLDITSEAGASQALKYELQNFHAKVTASGSTSLEAWREGVHDDLVLAAALAVWRGENLPQPARWISATERTARGWGMAR